MTPRSRKLIPLEHEIQVSFFEEVHLRARRDWRWGLIHAVPNGGKRTLGTARKMKAEGVKRGVPDVHVPIPVGDHPGAWIEFKRPGIKPGEEQQDVMNALRMAGYLVFVITDAAAAIETVEKYFKGGFSR